MTKRTPSASEMEILETLTRLGSATVQEVREALPEHRSLAHTTVITALQRLEDKGLVGHKKAERGKAFIFSATKPLEKVRRHLVRDFVTSYFGNDPVPLVSSLIQARHITSEELRQLRKLVSEAERSRKGES